jgi:hypothetical protein
MALAPASPDWRWVRAVQLADHSAIAVDSPLLLQEDVYIRQAMAWRRANPAIRAQSAPYIDSAVELYTNRPREKMLVEGFLLAGASDEDVCKHMDMSPFDVAAFASLFFDIRGRKPVTVASWVFGGFAHNGASIKDRTGMAHRIAWIGGMDVYVRYLTQGLAPTEERKLMKQFTMDATLRAATEFALTATSRPDQAMDVIRVATELAKADEEAAKEANEAKKGSADEAIADFVSSLSISVADPNDPANLSLPKEEKRVTHYEADLVHVG